MLRSHATISGRLNRLLRIFTASGSRHQVCELCGDIQVASLMDARCILGPENGEFEHCPSELRKPQLRQLSVSWRLCRGCCCRSSDTLTSPLWRIFVLPLPDPALILPRRRQRALCMVRPTPPEVQLIIGCGMLLRSRTAEREPPKTWRPIVLLASWALVRGVQLVVERGVIYYGDCQ
ncbi:hypothetical protein T12_1557 [Trichinella patagoniensis]|uniref:Uncharacterized protein n=1 Tax=Trichinella patagoniensis TaxID=990121 RepID=A0A0V1AAB4_9BILA|nr:hypothetical protein T12_1557 [Trichinella patagoniensis]